MGIGLAFLFPSHDINNMEGIPKDAKLFKKVGHSLKLSGQQGWSQGKTFAKIGLIWSSSECTLELIRGKTDLWNVLMAGCFTGTVLAVGGGPIAMAGGCAGFSLMSLAFEAVMGTHKPK
eukprot:TRINITY_DN782_c0_g1_i3.p2 TRINITY_DN782_c0_g1~~TRINITY_DN782_c0_g1_i3.p2  ORF type:complete len:119 (+),score=12.87 TRINITY_DN782_c0_g1_i3:216-572(+)